MRCVARAPGAGGSTRKQFSIHIAQLLFDKHNYHPRLLTVKLLAAAVCIVPHCCATLVSISWWEPPDIRHQTSPHHTVTLRNVGWCCVTRDSWDDAAWQLRWCCVTAEVMLRDSCCWWCCMTRDSCRMSSWPLLPQFNKPAVAALRVTVTPREICDVLQNCFVCCLEWMSYWNEMWMWTKSPLLFCLTWKMFR